MDKDRLSLPYRFELKVYLEDTDAQGLVYHANYLRFMERARSELLESLGYTPHPLPGQLRFVVHRVDIKFLRPARAGQLLEVQTDVKPASE
ncbi:MAG: YbgC/FadM family acyl-CoA thioesterase, partial [Deltaproteobacteria bacterium]